MASSYPGALDTLTNPDASDAMNDGAGHAANHTAANDAIEAIQATLGVDPHDGYADVAARLAALEGGGGGGGGLVLIDSGTFSGASEFHVDLFSSTYDDYLLVTACESSAASVELRARLRSSSTDNTSATYGWSQARNFNNLSQDSSSATDSSWWIGRGGAASGKRHHTRTEIFSPNEAATTGFMSHSAGHHSSSTTGLFDYIGGDFDNTTVFTGIKVYPASGTITGRWALYGYAK